MLLKRRRRSWWRIPRTGGSWLDHFHRSATILHRSSFATVEAPSPDSSATRDHARMLDDHVTCQISLALGDNLPQRYRPVRVPQSIAARVICRVAALVSIESVPGTQSAQTSPVEPTASAGMFSPQIYWNMCVQCWNADTLIFSTSVPVHPMLSPGTSTKTRPTRFPLPARDGRAHWDSPLSFWHGNSLNEGKPCERSNTRITLFKKRLIPVRSEQGSS